MSLAATKVIVWSKSQPANHRSIGLQLESEGLDYYQWSNQPGDVYGTHRHDFDKIIYVVEGMITFGVPEERRTFELSAGDRLELPAGVLHSAIVGSQGVVCYESHLSKE